MSTPRTDLAALGFARILVDKETGSFTELVDANFTRDLERENAALRAELAAHKSALPTCEKHKPDSGARSGCVICSGEQLSHALSRIDYACGEPNEMECSDYDVHYNEDEVVKRVIALRAEVEQARQTADYWKANHLAGNEVIEQLKGAIGQARFCIRELVPAGKDRELTLSVIDAAINARKESA